MKTPHSSVSTFGFLLAFALGFAVPAARAASAPAAETQLQYLSGTGPDDAVSWDFFCTGGRNSGVWTKIPVPSCWEQQGFGTYNYGRNVDPRTPVDFATEQGKYRREFTVPAAWRDRVVRLVFEGSMTDTEVTVNGKSAGPIHQGSFYRFQYDITALLNFDAPNLLEVTVSKMSANDSVNRAERLADYWVFGGIFRPVYLDARPAQFVDWTGIDARADGTFSAAVHLGAPAAAAGEVRAQVETLDGQLVGAPVSAAFAAGADTVALSGRFADVKLWTAETPNLYRVRLTLSPQTGVGHVVTERFGFRTFEVRANDGIYLNGKKIVLKGVNRHCFWPETGRTLTRAQSYADVRLLQEMNMNAVRMSHYPPDVHFLEACDELGLYVLDELGGWQKAYDTPTGARLIGQMIRRDVNHPSILFWDNGNEGGWNTANDGEFVKWDIQRRPVLHPWAVFSEINTDHYETHASTTKLSAGPQIFMPTEFLHGLYDGGHGAGLHDYWNVMSKSPTCAGGFLWVFADEGLVRTDQDGRVDNAGNRAPDGIVGPHHEREGSFYAIKEIWSPVQVAAPAGDTALAAGWDGTLAVENRYDFTNLDQCTFEWATVRFAAPGDTAAGHTTLAQGRLPGPSLQPRTSGSFKLPLPAGWAAADAVDLQVKDKSGQMLWRWTWSVQPAAPAQPKQAAAVDFDAKPDLIQHGGDTEIRLDPQTGRLASVLRHGRAFSFAGGPRLVAFRRADRAYKDLTAAAGGPELKTHWRVETDGAVALDYEYRCDGEFDILGVSFALPDTGIRSKRWLGNGPYRVWQNRPDGVTFDVHKVAYNDPVPGESFTYPEFKGYFRGWRWLVLETDTGRITVENTSGVPYFGLGKPKEGVDGLLDFPDVGLAFLDVIPAMRNKNHNPELTGPLGQPQKVSEVRRGTLTFRFEAP